MSKAVIISVCDVGLDLNPNLTSNLFVVQVLIFFCVLMLNKASDCQLGKLRSEAWGGAGICVTVWMRLRVLYSDFGISFPDS